MQTCGLSSSGARACMASSCPKQNRHQNLLQFIISQLKYNLSAYKSIRIYSQFVCLSIHPSKYVCLCVCVCVCVCACLLTCLPICLILPIVRVLLVQVSCCKH